jgi:hypothetical protein
MGSHDRFGFLKHKLWPKERSKVKLSIWLLAIKSQELPWFPCIQVACHIPLERSWRGVQLCFRSHLNKRSAKEVMAPKVARVPILRISKLQLGSPKTKWHLGDGPMARHKEYYKGKGGCFPQVWAVVNLMSLCLPMVRPWTKSAQTMH